MKHIILAFSLNFLFSACSQDVSENSHQPENNMDHTNCFKAGKGEGFIGNNCCEGLTRINACFEDSSGSKNEFGRSCICQYHLGACTPCGNGKCENKFGENKCSCPEDCEKGQAQQEIQKNIIHTGVFT